MNTHFNRQLCFDHLRNASILFACMFVCVCAAQAQSGRRSTTTTTTTAPSISGPKTVEKAQAKTPKIQLIVGIENRNPFSNVPYYLSDTVLDNCVRHLGDAEEVHVTASGRGMTRADAITRAKTEKEAYVVWLQIESDVTSSSKQSRNDPGDLYVRYTIFEPVTTKIKQWGRTHQSIYRTGPGGVSAPTSSKSSPIYSEYALKQAAREAAERVLEAFDIRLRDERVIH
jgi:hypothetical protein